MKSTTYLAGVGRLSVPLAVGVATMAMFFGWVSAGPAGASQATVPLGTAAPFAALSYSGVTTTANPTSPFITGNVGVSPTTGASITGFTTADVNGTIYTVDGAGPSGNTTDPSLLSGAKSDLGTAYTFAAGATPTNSTNYADITGLTLVPGVYNATSTMSLTGTVTLNGNGVYIFQVGSGLTTSTTSTVALENGAQAGCVFWQVGSSATLGGGTFNGSILASTSIMVTSAVSVTGRLLAKNGDVTLVGDTITVPAACTASTTPTATTTAPTATTTAPTATTTAPTATTTAPTATTTAPTKRRRPRPAPSTTAPTTTIPTGPIPTGSPGTGGTPPTSTDWTLAAGAGLLGFGVVVASGLLWRRRKAV